MTSIANAKELTISEFSRKYACPVSIVYDEIASGRLKTTKRRNGTHSERDGASRISHGADAFRVLACAYRDYILPPRPEQSKLRWATSFSNPDVSAVPAVLLVHPDKIVDSQTPLARSRCKGSLNMSLDGHYILGF